MNYNALTEYTICRMCERQVDKTQTIKYQRQTEELGSYSEPFLFYCMDCYMKYNMSPAIVVMGNKYQKV